MKNYMRTLVVALSLVSFMLSAPATATDLSVDSPTSDEESILVLEDGNITVVGYHIEATAEPTPLDQVPGEACTYIRGEIAKLAEVLGTSSSLDVNTSSLDVTEDPEPAPYDSDKELEPVKTEECAQMRDEAQDVLWENAPAPHVPETCATLRGIKTCVTVQHWQCDVGFLTYYNMISVCIGGVFPDN